ncbi:MAG: hypothetical protein L0287_28120, partial [Anaerolineae bacterium]|nr:hypothetical protein [Anaerolineae bacterium]
TDLDGKGDWLVMASNTDSSDWTVKGVQVFQDANNNVGSLTPMFTDTGASTDGFETMIFDQGAGNDPDIAWIRVSPQDLSTIEMAVKRSAIGNPLKYLIDMWVGHASLDPALFDYSDHFTHEQAGAADPGFPLFYPIKAVAELDNSCRMAVGFQPTGSEPGLCQAFESIEQGSNPSCNTTSGDLFKCNKEGGTWNSTTCQCELPQP